MKQRIERHSLSGAALPQQQISRRRLRCIRSRNRVSNLQEGSANHEGGLARHFYLVLKSSLDAHLKELPEFVHRERVNQSNVVAREGGRIRLRRPDGDGFLR